MKTIRILAGSILLAASLLSCSKSDNSDPLPPVTGTKPEVFFADVGDVFKTSAWPSGWILHAGSSQVTEQGICWGLQPSPTTGDHVIRVSTAIANISHRMDSLTPGTRYYVRLFATNQAGTGYSPEKTFRTLPDTTFLSVFTFDPDLVAMTQASVGGGVADSGLSKVTSRGICWGTMELPALNNNVENCGSGTGEFSCFINGLTMNTRYYYRAWAINAEGPAFGGVKTFRTLTYPVLFVPGTYQGWNPADSSTVITSVKSNQRYEGYIWFPAGTEYKFTKENNWTVYYGDNGADGTLELSGANIAASDAGYYKVNVDLMSMTHFALKTTWGLVGTASPGGWENDADMTWDPATRTWMLYVTLAAGDLKFRANHNWDLNYGDDGPNGILEQGGSNIQVAIPGTYRVVLDLSGPWYRYSLTKQ